MKTKEIRIDKTEAENAVTTLMSNPEFLLIDGNLFSTSKISTVIKPRYDEDDLYMNKKAVIEFAYSDKVMPMNVKLTAAFQNVSALEFVKTSKMINEAQFAEIEDKMVKCYRANFNYDIEKLKQILDDVALNETLLILTQAVNKEDCEETKSDFLTKFSAWKDRRESENKELENAVSMLFNNIISVKVWKK